MKVVPINATTVAHAIVLAAASYGDDPVKAMTAKAGTLRRSVVAAASGLQIAACANGDDVARAIGCERTGISRARRLADPRFVAASLAVLDGLVNLYGVESVRSARKLKPHSPQAAPLPSPKPPAAVSPAPAPTPAPALQADQARAVAEHLPEQVTQLRKPTQRTVRYARRFLTASWPMDEIAWLFDADPGDLDAALKAA